MSTSKMLFPTDDVTNYQRAIVRFRREPNLIPLGAFLCTMKVIATDKVKTANTDCVRVIRYNPEYFNSLTVEQCVSALLHEAHHKYLNFFPRFERWAKAYKGQYSRTELLKVFNYAQDYFINWMIKHQWNYPLGSGWLYNPEFNLNTHTTESLADLLLKQPQPEQPEQPQQPDQGDSENEGDKDDDGNPASQPQGDQGDDDDADDEDQDQDGGSGDSDGEGDADGEDEDDDADDDDDDTGDEGPENEAPDDEGEGSEKEDEQPDPADNPDNPANPDRGDVGEGDDITLPEEYNGSIENELDDQQIRELEANNRSDMAQSIRAAKGISDGTGSDPFSQAAAESLREPVFDFRSALMRWATAACNHGSWTWFRPNRRLRTSQGLAMPKKYGKQLGTAVFAIDSSGSTDGPMVRYFMDEMTKALRDLDYDKAVIIWCSDAVARVEEFTKAEANGRNSLFGGVIYRAGFGTEFTPVFEYVAEHYKDVKCITYLTDGGSGEWDVQQCGEIIKKKLRNVPTLWLIDDPHGYSYVINFAEWCKKYQAGTMTRLPAEALRKVRDAQGAVS